jgi:DNA-binding MarR family transcriptional regulator
MSTATAVKISTSEQESLTLGELRAWRGLLRAHACLAKRLDAELEQAHHLPMTSYEVLHYLEEAPGGRMRMCDLAEQAQLSRSGLTRMVDRLEREELLERCSCDHDARGS